MVILVGERGIGKSSMLRALMPPGKQDRWYTDNISLKCGGNANARGRQIEAMHGCVIVEMAELAGVRAADVEELERLNHKAGRQMARGLQKANSGECPQLHTCRHDQATPNAYPMTRQGTDNLLSSGLGMRALVMLWHTLTNGAFSCGRKPGKCIKGGCAPTCREAFMRSPAPPRGLRE